MRRIFTVIVAVLSSFAPLSNAANPVYTSKQYVGAVFNGVLQYSGLVASATGVVTVPKVTLPASADVRQVYNGSAIVGMYGWQCTGEFVSAGVSWSVRNKTVQYSAYLTNGTQVIPATFKVSAGDQISLYAEVFGGGGAAQAGIDNLSTGKSQTQYFSVFNNYGPCNRTANWLVSDPMIANKQAPFAAFDYVNFTSASYNSFDPVNGMQNRGLTNVTSVNLVNASNKVIAAGTTPNNSTVKVTYKK